MSDRTRSWNLSTFFPLIPARTTHIAYLDFRAGSWVLMAKERQWQTGSFTRTDKDAMADELEWTCLGEDLRSIQSHLPAGPSTIAILPGAAEHGRLLPLVRSIWPDLSPRDVVLIANTSPGLIAAPRLSAATRAARNLRCFCFLLWKPCRTRIFICFSRAQGSPLHLVSARYASQRRFISRASQSMTLFSRSLHRLAAWLWLFPLVERDHILYVEKC